MNNNSTKKHTLRATRDYAMFRDHRNQQPMSNKHINRLAESMKKNGFFPSKPISFYRDPDTKSLVIIDGHHRLRAAQIAGVEVYMVEESPEVESLIGDINAGVKKWTSISFVKLFADRGSIDYQTLLAYIDRGLPLPCAAAALMMETPGSGNYNKKLSIGAFKVKSTQMADYLLSIVDSTKQSAKHISKQAYMHALGACFWVKDFDPEIMVKRILTNPTMIQPVARREQALDLLDEAYNYRTQKKLNLKFQAEEALRERKSRWPV